MKHLLLLPMFICSIVHAHAQGSQASGEIEHAGSKISLSRANSTDDIAAYVNTHLEDEVAKARAIYAWVTTNIRYDKDSANIINSDLHPAARVTEAFRRRKGVCENFAAIFNDICVKAGLNSYVVSGYTKQSGRVDKTGHSWCAVALDHTWYLFDPTWDAGNSSNANYFMAAPADFIESHMPFDPLWQLSNYPVSHEQFYSGDLYKRHDAPYFNYSDSISAYARMDSMQRLQSSALRIQRDKLYNPLVKDNYNYVKMNIEIIGQDNDLELYNSSMQDLNEVTVTLNNFIGYRNNQFTPLKSDSELEALLFGVEDKLNSSLKKLDQVDKSQSTLTLGTEPVRSRLNILLKKIQEQEEFLKRYLHTEKSARRALFY